MTTQLIKTKPTQHHSFFGNLPPLFNCLSACLFAVNMRALHSFRVNTEICALVFVADSRVGTEDNSHSYSLLYESTRLHLVGANELNEPFNGDIYF